MDVDVTNAPGLDLPILLYLDGILSVDAGEGLKAIGARFDGLDTFVCKAPIRANATDTPGWILEASGRFRELAPKARRREWASAASFLFQLVQSEFRASEPRNVTVHEMLDRLASIQEKFSEAPIAADFRRHLGQYASDELISSEILRAWPI